MNTPHPNADVSIDVISEYLSDQSIPMQHRYTFAYRITITNNAPDPLTLRRRFWQITDDHGHIETVEGEGVVGQQPTLAMHESFVYQSGAQLKTPYGQMQGYYTFEDAHGQQYRAHIPAFLLSIPRVLH